ncbi:MAG: Tetratricopeptide repeat-containing protein [Gemmatimonadetes bacterium]|nr:Tetratricopeptide repeat-containing protein [Gemmatimonadota bacterium]
MLLPIQAPAAALRSDLERRRTAQAHARDGAWLQVAQLLTRASELAPGAGSCEQHERLFRSVISIGADGTPPVQQASLMDQAIDVGTRAAVGMEDAGRFALAATCLRALLVLVPAGDIPREHGELLNQLARVARQMGDVKAAQTYYEEIESIGEASSDDELLGLAWLGQGVLQTFRGNHPQGRALYTRVLAHDGVGAQAIAMAHQMLLISAASAGDLSTAAQHGWSAFTAAKRQEDASAALVNLSQLLLDAGHPRPATKGFAHVLGHASLARLSLPALGGYAVAVARDRGLASGATLRAAARRLDEWEALLDDGDARADVPGPRLSYQRAVAHLEMAVAFATINAADVAEGYRVRAQQIAQVHDHHEIDWRAETLQTRAEWPPVPAEMHQARSVLFELEQLEADDAQALAMAPSGS